MRALILVLASFGLIAAAPAARSDTFPSETIRIIVPYAAGGIADVLARLVGVRMESAFRQPVIVENKAGANGTIAQQFVAGAKPDGYTLLLGNTSTQVVNAHLYTKLPINIAKAFQPIGLIAASPMMLVVSASSPAGNVADLRLRVPAPHRSILGRPATVRLHICRWCCLQPRARSRSIMCPTKARHRSPLT